LGGPISVITVMVCNLLVSRISALYLTLLFFIGQVFSSVIIDAVIAKSFAPYNLIGGVLVTAGLLVNVLVDRKRRVCS
jgi:transporter family-2 protein